MGWDHQPHAQPPTWRARVFLFVWIIANNKQDWKSIHVHLTDVFGRRNYTYDKTTTNPFLMMNKQYIHMQLSTARTIKKKRKKKTSVALVS
jgi:hypothetical protein